MPPDVRLSRTARARIAHIADWTVATFGPEQAARYRDGLLAHLRRLAEGQAQTRPLERLTGLPEHAAYDTTKYERHVMVFTRTETEIVVIDILHDAQDLTAFER